MGDVQVIFHSIFSMQPPPAAFDYVFGSARLAKEDRKSGKKFHFAWTKELNQSFDRPFEYFID